MEILSNGVLKEWFIAISSFITGIAGYLVFFPQNKKKMELENTKTMISVWKDVADSKQKEIEEKDILIDTLRDKIDELVEERFKDQKKYNDLEVLFIKEGLKKCEVAKCPKREPYTGF